jgi:hypothetical protein
MGSDMNADVDYTHGAQGQMQSLLHVARDGNRSEKIRRIDGRDVGAVSLVPVQDEKGRCSYSHLKKNKTG